MFERSSGILLHPTSLPSRFGIGEIGGSIFDFITFLADLNQKLWQILPLGPTGYGDSPYQCFSSFAGNPLLISIEDLLERGLLNDADLEKYPQFPDLEVDFGPVIISKTELLRKSFPRFRERQDMFPYFKTFVDTNKHWLEDFAIFMGLKSEHGGDPWNEWTQPFRNPKSPETIAWKENNSDEIMYHKYLQFIFSLQWQKVKTFANEKDLKIIGDIPIYVAYDSADCWANQSIFQLDDEGNPINVAGVPPDYFSETGQLWGNPLYDWEAIRQSSYQFWVDRVAQVLRMVDVVRIDHFRGFEAYWQIPASETTAINGKWVKGPGGEIFDSLRKALGDLPIIAEDLGVITEDVTALRKTYDLPGMKILQYAFNQDESHNNDYLPHTFEQYAIAYSGTHDNDTTIGWFDSASPEVQKHFEKYTGSNKDDIVSDMIRLVWSSTAVYAIIPMQDFLREPTSARMNTPGTPSGNWKWRFSFDGINDIYSDHLKEMTSLFGR